MSEHYVIDFGSRSVKLHQTCNGRVNLQSVQSWDPICDGLDRLKLGGILANITKQVPEEAGIHVVGTAAARRDNAVADAINSVCEHYGLTYETITQRREAELIRQAFSWRRGHDIINAGGGSIQIVCTNGRTDLVEFGISDLNKMFNLDGPVGGRDLAGARELLQRVLPNAMGRFIYSGGEYAYLENLGAFMTPEGHCTRTEFLRVTRPLLEMNVTEMEELSPFDPGWMRGAVASNLIVETCLLISGEEDFIASDLNIADGIISGIIAGRGHAENHRF